MVPPDRLDTLKPGYLRDMLEEFGDPISVILESHASYDGEGDAAVQRLRPRS